MNIKWLKQNLMVAVFLGVFLLLLIGVIMLQRRAASQRELVEIQLEQQEAELSRFRNTKPSPSRENIEILRHDRDQLDQIYSKLMETAGQSNLQVPEMRPIAFSQMLAQKLARLRQAAGGASVGAPENFSFGFSRYVATLPVRNLPEDQAKRVLTQLTKQLLAVEKISELLIANRVEEIKQIRRAEVEPGTASADALGVGIVSDPQGLYQALPFEFQFVCTTETLRGLLNNLSKSPWFFAVRNLQIETESAQARPGTAGLVAESESTIARTRLSVTMRIDLVEFAQAEKKPGA